MRYSAFISYNHGDRQWAVWLLRALERYRVPKRLEGQPAPFGTIGKRLPPVFRDRDELASSADLAASVQQALEESAMLVVLCSPRSAASRWVNEEIRTFIALGRRDRIRLMIVDGEPGSTDPARNCIPPAILEGADGEPLAADARRHQDGKQGALLKILAAMLGVPYDELRQREASRRQRRLALLAAASTVGLVVTSGLAVAAVLARNEAEAARKLAEQRTITAERTVSFIKDMFRTSDPTNAQGRSEEITAREIVDRGARQLETGLEQEPAARADLAATLADVYNALGLHDRGRQIALSTFGMRHDQRDVMVRQLTTLGESEAFVGDYGKAEVAFSKAQALLESPLVTGAMRSRLLVGLGMAQTEKGDFDKAAATLRQAIAIDRSLGRGSRADIARDLEALGRNSFALRDLRRSRLYITEALEIRKAIEGENSPSVADNRSTLASIAYNEGNLGTAERLYREILANDERVLGPKHPDLAITLNNLARMLIDQRRFAAALPLLERALPLLEAQRSTHGDMVFLLSNLALAKRYTGQIADADRYFQRAVEIARMRDHAMLGPILTDYADFDCATGRVEAGLMKLRDAEVRVTAEYSDVPWRVSWVSNVKGVCLVRAGRAAEGRTALDKSLSALERRWPPQTLIGYEARRHARR